jgi:ABC-type branched-subunit amino acid transport system ATPase component
MTAEPEQSEPLLEVRSLGLRYGRVAAVTDLSLTVHRGEVVALVGPNGAGKTSTLRSIAGFLPRERVRQTGDVLLEGSRIGMHTPWDVARRGVAMITSGTKVFASLTVREHLRLAAPANSGSKAAIDEMLTLFPALAQRLGSSAAMLSGGERQMLAIAAAMLRRPTLLLVDELSQGLAPSAVAQLVRALRELNRDGLSMLIVEQSLATAVELADRCYALDAGRLVAEGSSAEFSAMQAVQGSYLGSASRRVADRPVTTDGRAADESPALEVHGLGVSFGGVEALRDVSWTAARGECVGLVGPNGAGKSTLLNCVNRVVRPSKGTVRVLGRPAERLRPYQLAGLGVARTFQSAEHWRDVTVVDLVATGLHAKRVRRTPALRAAMDALDFVGLRSIARSWVRDIPYGHAKLVDLARALVLEPTLLLLDEPASGLSGDERVAMAELLNRIKHELHVTQVIVEHDMALVQECCDRIVVLSHGQVIGDGVPEVVLAQPNVIRELLDGHAGADADSDAVAG